jgi:hypothetical protein
MDDPVATAFTDALVVKNAAALRGMLADPLDFQAVAGRRYSSATTPGEVVDDVILGRWFGEDDTIRRLLWLRADTLADTAHFAYRLQVGNPGGEFLVEQQAYYRLDPDGRIAWLRMLCPGYRPDPDRTGH